MITYVDIRGENFLMFVKNTSQIVDNGPMSNGFNKLFSCEILIKNLF